MIQVSKNVYVESKIVACNLGLVTTKEGLILIDTPIRPTDAVKWREEVSKKGDIRYVINTEEHPDHCQSSFFFPGTLITSQETRDKLVKEPVEKILGMVKHMDPEAAPLMKSFKLRLADIAFTGDLNLYLGDHTIHLFPLVGHSTGGIGVYIPEEKVVFTTDCVFNQLKSWLHESFPEKWLESLKKIGELDVDVIVPGHGEICKKDHLKEQARVIQEWVKVVKSAIKQGLSAEEAAAKITSPDPYPMQTGIPIAEEEVNRLTVARLYQLYSK